jgi:hypothetical protein
MVRKVSKEKRRIERAAAYVLKRLNSKYVFLVEPATASDVKRGLILTVERSGRGTQDKSTFIITYNAELSIRMSRNEIRQTLFHEWLHAASWDLYDELETAINHLKPSPLRDELHKRYLDTRENVVYHMERALGPHVFPFIEYKDQ